MADSVDVTPDSPLVLDGGTHEYDTVRLANGGHIAVTGAATVRVGNVEHTSEGAAVAAEQQTTVIRMQGVVGQSGTQGGNGYPGMAGASGPVGSAGGSGGGGAHGSSGGAGMGSPPATFSFKQLDGQLEVQFVGGGGAGGAGGSGGPGGNGGNGSAGPGGAGGFGGSGGNGGNGGDGGNGGSVTIYIESGEPTVVITANIPGGAGGPAGMGGRGGNGGAGNPSGPSGQSGAPGMSGVPGRPGLPGAVTVRRGGAPQP